MEVAEHNQIQLYDKKSRFRRCNKFCLEEEIFPLTLKCNEEDKTELVSANTDYSITLYRLQNEGKVAMNNSYVF
jgi:hypothetical protein